MKQLQRFFHFVLTTLLLLIAQVNYAQFDVPTKPIESKQTAVYDYANILDTAQKSDLERKLLNYADTTSTQIVLITVPSLKGESIGLLGPRWGQEWGIGQKGKDNGVLILFSEQDRQVGIYPGYGIEMHLTAGQGGEIIRNIIIPEFKKGDYFSGLNKGADAIIGTLSGTYKADPARMEGDNLFGGLTCFIIIIFLVFFIIALSKNKNNKGGGGNHGKREGKWGLGPGPKEILTSVLFPNIKGI